MKSAAPPLALASLLLACAAPTATTPATTLPLGPGRAQVQRDATTVRLELFGPAGGLATAYVAAGDRVFVLHASAALGTGIYRRAGATWRRVQDFSWECRDRGDAGCRARHLAGHRWWGETYAQGSTRRTLIIDRELLGPDGKVVLVGYVYPSQIAAWPADPGDDTVNEAILRGELPDEATFIPDRWGQLP